MAEPIQHPVNGNEIAAILAAISPDRFKTYLSAAVEVGLRNGINLALSRVYTPNWWECKNLFDLLDEERKGDLVTVLKRIRNRKLEPYSGQVVAGLSFGFWVGILDGRYNPPIWGGQLRTAFPFLPPGRGRKSLHERVRVVADAAQSHFSP
jgi:hypothetical protein